jgi:hypothetical protein
MDGVLNGGALLTLPLQGRVSDAAVARLLRDLT